MDKRQYYQKPQVAQKYEQKRVESAAGLLTQQEELTVLRKVARPGTTWAELACGTGRLLRALTSRAIAGARCW